MKPQTPFELFNLAEKFQLDADDLKMRYDKLRIQIHPDRFVNSTATEKRIAANMTANLNEAYLILKDPLKRASWILAKRGGDPFAESNTQMPVDFLERQIELRETLDELNESQNQEEAKKINTELIAEIKEDLNLLAIQIDANDQDNNELAVATARRLKYLINCQEQTKKIIK